jgi:multiple RNA-binding domain-containing protein 1
MKGSDANAIPVPVPEPKADSASGVVQVEDVKQDDTGDLDDAEWLKRRQAAVVPESTGEEGVGESSTMQVDHDKRLAPEEILIRQTHRLFLRNLSFHTTTDSLRSYLSTYGPISEIHLPLSKTTKEPLGTAFVKFENAEDAVKVWQEVDGRTVMGRLIHVLPGRGKPGEQVIIPRSGNVSGSLGVEEVDSGTHANDGGLFGKVLGKEEGKNVKSEVDKRGKTESSKGLNWATLYMNSDAVASSVADRMGIKKSDILNSDALLPEETEGEERRGKEVNGAVKLALAETSVINETKKYFETHGVILTRLEGSSDVAEGMKGGKRTIVPRSKTTLLVKNIPYGTTLDVLRALFEPFGTLKRALMPPAGTLAVVEFEEAADAAGAFKGVSYKRLGNAVIYLEKAPEGLMRDVGDVGVEEETRGIEGNEAAEVLKRVEAAAAARGGDKEEEEPLTEAGSTLYVKNLSFNTTTERLESVFSSLPSFSFARVSTKPDPKNPTARLSMGFGFLGFKTKDAANRALKGLKGYKLDGHQLEVKFAQRDREGDEVEGKKGGASEGKKGKTTKMIVKNVPFEASKKDIRDLFR